MKSLVIVLGKTLFLFRRRQRSRTPRRVLVVKIGALGDVLMTTPFIRALRDTYPAAHITYAVGQWSAPVLEHSPHIDALLPFDESIIWKMRMVAIICFIRRLRMVKPDVTFLLDKHFSVGVLGFCIGGYRIGFDRRGEGFAHNLSVPYGEVRYEIDYNLDLLRTVTHPKNEFSRTMEVFVTHEEQRLAQDVYQSHAVGYGPDIAMMVGGAQNPNQTAFLKRWPLRHYATLAGLLIERNRGLRIWLFGGPSDKPLNNEIVKRCPNNTINVAGIGSVKASIALMSLCKTMVTHDTGPMHMAAAAGIPVVSFSGPVHPDRTVPRGSRDLNIWKSHEPDALCYDDEGKFPKDIEELRCMAAITPQEVAEALRAYGY